MKNTCSIVVRLLSLIFLISLFSASCQLTKSGVADRPVNQEILSDEGEPILVGALNRDVWQHTPYNEWFAVEYATYEVNEAVLAELQDATGSLEVIVFLGTWCYDSQREVPRFYKLMDRLDFDDDRLTVVGLDNHPDRYKQSPQHEEMGWGIDYVPTFIFLVDGQEIGRITESPVRSLEEDLLVFLQGDMMAL